MSAVTAPVSASATAKVTKKRAGGSAKAKHFDHPKYSDMIKNALTALKERGGSSRHAILKYIVTHYKLDQNEPSINAHLKLALRSGVKNGLLKQSKGTGALGSFKLGEKAEKKAKKPKVAKKPKAAGSPKKAKRPKKAAAAGEAKPKKPKAAKKAKSPTKAKVIKPKTAKKPKVAKSPKKPKAAKAAKPKVAKPKKVAAKK